MKRLLQLFALVCLPAIAFAQGGNIGSQSSPVVNSLGRPLPGISVAICAPLATTAASVTSNVATLTMASNPAAAGFVVGMTIQVTGFTGADTFFNQGTFTNGTGITNGATILSVTSTTITYPLTHANASATSNGSVLQMGNTTTSCAGLSTITSDPALVNTLTQPLTSDGLGNWNAFAAPGVYYAQFYGAGITTKLNQYGISCLPQSSGLCGAALGTNNAWTGSNSFTGTPGPFYVATTGSDSNDCLAASLSGGHGPCLTPQHAVNVALGYNFGASGTFINVNLGTGTFQCPTISGHIAGSGSFRQTGTQLVLNGNGAANTTCNDPAANGFGVEISNWIPVEIQNMTVAAANTEYGLFVQNDAILQIGANVTISCPSGTCSTAIHAEEAGQIEDLSGSNTTTISGAWSNIISLGTGGSFQTNNTIACSSLTYSNAFIFMDQDSNAQFLSPFALSGCGAVTGTRYIVRGNSTIANFGGPALPGNAIGSVQSGGRYEPSSLPTSSAVNVCTNGSAVAQTGSGSHGGSIIVTTGSACGTPSGNITFNWAEYQSPGGGTLGCTAANANGGATAWVNGATTAMSVTNTQFTINFTNSATNLVSSSTYQLLYVCGADF